MSATDMPFERLEALLRGDEPRTLEEKNRAAMLAELRAGELGAPEPLQQRVLEGATPAGARRRRIAMPRRRLVLLVPVAACLAVGAALIHGAFNSGPSFSAEQAVPSVANGRIPNHGSAWKTAQKGSAHTKSRAYYGTATGTGDAPTGTGDALSGNFSQESAVNGTALTAAGRFSTAGSANLSLLHARQAVTIPSNRLVHADASLQVVVPSHAALTNATNKATQIVAGLGGYAQSVQYQASRGGDGNAFLDLRVPVGKTETAIGKLGALGKLLSQQVSTQDLQQQFSRQTNVIGTLKRKIAIYEQALSSGAVSGSQRVEVQISLSNAEHELTSERKARSHTAASAATAAIQLQLTTNQHAFAVGPHKSGRVGRLLGNAGDFLGLEGIIVLYALIVAGPIALLLWLFWAGLRERRRRDEKRLLASA
ncbi:MAG: DUF4349 domain-containing protein [Gaiellaceae bacterium]